MFFECILSANLNLSNFNTDNIVNIVNMKPMLFECK